MILTLSNFDGAYLLFVMGFARFYRNRSIPRLASTTAHIKTYMETNTFSDTVIS
jgi:hypothetical protein